jgi:hypothetical protein
MVYITMLGHISSFLAEYLLFAFLIALARSSSLMWKRNSEGVRIVPDLHKKAVSITTLSSLSM